MQDHTSPPSLENAIALQKYGVGQPVRRKEDDALIRGKGRYTDDVAPQPALHALMLRSPHAHAKFTINVAKARGMPGVSLILTAATVWGGRVWLRNSETLVFAVGDPASPEARFAEKLAAMLKNNFSRFKVRVVTNADNAKALAQFDRGEANLAVLRTDALTCASF